MLTVAPPDALEMRSNAAFEALMWAMSRPGDIRSLPDPGPECLVETLIDLECTAYAESPALRGAIVASGAMPVEDIAQANFVFLDTLADADAKLARINIGSALYPDDGATLIVPVAHRGGKVRLTGPGIAGSKEVALDVPAVFWAWRQRAGLYPEGVDIVFIDGAEIVALPRSTQVEVL